MNNKHSDYFSFYSISPCFFPDISELKKKYYGYSKQYHPDFFTLEDKKKQSEVLELSSYNNKAYTTLSDFNKRIKYILSLFFDVSEETSHKMDDDFLMDMMELNENISEVSIENDEDKMNGVKEEIEKRISDLDLSILPEMKSFDVGNREINLLEKIKDYYFKRKYILRIQENIANFAGL
ncbi:MAG: Fe-S protein assembly co-chaperone HscB [Saprospiraceae bacterium]|nr:Fe-S protein assembly co-chaperone HscB [Saprospiraceae bacterium]MBK9041875.1 Fe-S protein assembly co-chaperone HscB [Saprospiraceae bacterium]